MRLDIVRSLLAIAAAALIALGFFEYYPGPNGPVLVFGAFVMVGGTLTMALGATMKLDRSATNCRLLSGLFFILSLLSNLIFAAFYVQTVAYMIVNGLLMLLYVLLMNLVLTTRQ